MNPTVQRVLDMLRDERTERRCAAAMVLGTLGVRDMSVVRALGETLREDNRVLRLYALEGLSELGATGVSEYVMPLIDSQDEEVRTRAQRVLEKQGPQAARLLARELATAPLARRRAIVSVLARNRTPESLDGLLLMLRDPDVAEHTLSALRTEADHASLRDRTLVARKAVHMLRQKSVRGDVFCTANALRLIGYVGDARVTSVLAGFLAGQNPGAIRAAACAALRRPLGTAAHPNGIVTKLLSLADDADATVARTVLDTLRNVDVKPNMVGPLMKLCDSRYPEVRTFVADRLGTMDTPIAARQLLETLRKAEPTSRDAAARSLMRLSSAIKPVVQAVLREEAPSQIVLFGRVLKAHGARVSVAYRKAIARHTQKIVERKSDDGRVAPLLDIMGGIDAKLRDRTLIDLALRLKQRGRYHEAQALLRPLSRSEHLDGEARFALAVLGLTLGSCDLSGAQRQDDPMLEHFRILLNSKFPLATRLRKERSLDSERLYYLGFCLAESESDDDKQIGIDVLKQLCKKSPNSKLGKAAKNKLSLVGAAA